MPHAPTQHFSNDSGMLDVPLHFNFTADVIEGWAATRPTALGLWWTNDDAREEQYTFQDLATLSRRAANFFQASGIGRGDRVLLLLHRVPQWWIAMLGLIRLGAVPVPGTPLLTSRDLDYRIAAAKIGAVITDAEGSAKLSSFDGVRIGVGPATPGWTDFDTGAAAAAETFADEPIRSDAPGILFFTSATTGHPKMVLHTQASYGIAHRLTGKYWLDLKPDDVHWNISDVGWAKAAWSSFYAPWQMGACVFVADSRGKFDPVKTLRILETYPITTWCAPPTALRLIVREDLSKYKFPHLRHAVTAGEPLNPEVLALWQSATGLTLHEAYGQTETVMLIGNFRCTGTPVRPGSMGRANPAIEIALLDEHLNELPAGQEGEVAVRVAPNRPLGLFQEYWQHPEVTADRFRGDWYLTGDRATRDKDGYFWFIGRKDDVIKSSGYRIGPFEVESALLEHSAVLDVAVVGKPDPIRGQIVKAFVVLCHGTEPSESLKQQLQDHCKQAVAPYKYPRAIEFVGELPKTTSGKTRHVELRQRA
ncbi:MAG: AMP-binding protein [Verrucomicrobiota bacterium]